MRLLLTTVLLLLVSGCSLFATVDVRFVEPAGATVRVGRREPEPIPATVTVRQAVHRVELSFDEAALERLGLTPEQAATLLAEDRARVRGRVHVRGTGEPGPEFRLPAELVRRALLEDETLRYFWPADGTTRLYYKSDASFFDDEVIHMGRKVRRVPTVGQFLAGTGMFILGLAVAVVVVVVVLG